MTTDNDNKKDGRRSVKTAAAAAVAVAATFGGASGIVGGTSSIVTAVPNVAGVSLGDLKSLEDTVLGNALARTGTPDAVEIAAGWQS